MSFILTSALTAGLFAGELPEEQPGLEPVPYVQELRGDGVDMCTLSALERHVQLYLAGMGDDSCISRRGEMVPFLKSYLAICIEFAVHGEEGKEYVF